MDDQIDNELCRERTDRKKKAKREVKVLLLGQSESGKSTVLKNFCLKYVPTQWKAKLRFWCAVIQLNLIQNVLTILDLMHGHLTALDFPQAQAPPRRTRTAACPSTQHARTSPSTPPLRVLPGGHRPHPKHRLLHLRLSLLREVGDLH
ncbi:G-protein alpha subunit-domain-containing protein [Mycena olivaceomarginata]|nr:G-protein alpha subunit-domain-containing protein [Mycena olivaceomarginata]